MLLLLPIFAIFGIANCREESFSLFLHYTANNVIVQTRPLSLAMQLAISNISPVVLLSRATVNSTGELQDLLVPAMYSPADHGWQLPKQMFLEGTVNILRVAIATSVVWAHERTKPTEFVLRLPFEPVTPAASITTPSSSTVRFAPRGALTVVGTPFVSPTWVVFSKNGTTWASTTAFATLGKANALIDLPAVLAAAEERSTTNTNHNCADGTLHPWLPSVAATASRWFVGTPHGLMLRSASRREGWDLASLPLRCIAHIQLRRQHDPYNSNFSESGVYVLPARAQNTHASAFRWLGPNASLIELTDAQGQTIGDVASSLGLTSIGARIIAADASIVEGAECHILLFGTPEHLTMTSEREFFDLVVLDPDLGWSRRFAFLADASAYPGSSTLSIPQRIEKTLSFVSTVRLVGMASSGSFPTSSEIFVWGDVLLYSVNAGRSFRQLATGGEPVVQLVTSHRGWVAVLTDDGCVLTGRPSLGYLVRVVAPDTSALFFDETGALHSLRWALSKASFPKAESLDVAVLRAVMSDLNASPSSKKCNFQRVAIEANHSAILTRIPNIATGDKTFGIGSPLPPRVFLDCGDSYMFRLHLLGSPGKSLKAVSLSFWLSEQSLFWLNVKRTENSIAHVVTYDIRVTDRGADLSHQRALKTSQYGPPGVNLRVGALHIAPTIEYDAASTFACDFVEIGDSVQPVGTVGNSMEATFAHVRGLELYSGCPPAQILQLNRVFSGQRNAGCSQELLKSGVVCVNFDSTFIPVFELRDEVTGNYNRYVGQWSLVVVGGSSTFDGALERQEEFEEMSSKIFSESEEVEGGVVWGCWPGSPCAGVVPRFPAVPAYYFLFEAVASDDLSYCIHSTTFVVRVSNLPLAFTSQVAIWFSTIAVLVGILVVGAIRKQKDGIKVGVESEKSKEKRA